VSPPQATKKGAGRLLRPGLSRPCLASLLRWGESLGLFLPAAWTNGTTAIGGWSKAKRLLGSAAAEIHGSPLAPWRLHDIRRTTATGLQRLGVGLQVVESVLGHVSGSRAGIVGVYQRHQFEAEKRHALEAWAREIVHISGGRVHSASATLAGSGSLVAPASLTAFAGATLSGSGSLLVDVQPIDMRWVAAVGQADKHNVTEPLFAYLRTPGTPFGPWERWWLEQLLERMQGFIRKKGGRYVPLTYKSRNEIHAIAEKLVHDLQNQGLPLEAAIDTVARAHPQWYANDKGGPGASLAAYFKRGQKPSN
jgi:hypothetical protein